MMCLTTRKLSAVIIFLFAINLSFAQDPGPKNKSIIAGRPEPKPYRILTSGKRITIKSSKDISYIIAWTTTGNRFVEQTNPGTSSYNFTVPSPEKIVFIMIELNGKRYTEKIGVQ